ncbi:MAG: FISUMP domain-containing protein [Bacteroidota bacterium]
MLKFFLVFLTTLFFQFSRAQEFTLIDERDNQTYDVETINGVSWMLQNLNLETNLSLKADTSRSEALKNLKGQFYHMDELEDICPAGWQLPKASDWIDYFIYVSRGREASIRFKAFRENIEVKGYEGELDVFEPGNPLNLQPTGIYQGDEHVYKGGYANYWITDLPTQKDIMFEAKGRSMRVKHVRVIYEGKAHIHLGNPWTQIHSHDHHLEHSNEDEMRRFMVRCVKYVENQ